MSEERDRILGMLAEGKITAEEAARLLDAVDSQEGSDTPAGGTTSEGRGGVEELTGKLPKYLYVKILSTKGDNVDIKVPLGLVKAGLKLTSLIPPQAMDEVNQSMAEQGISIDFDNLKPEDIDELVQALREMEVTVKAANGDDIRIYCA